MVFQVVAHAHLVVFSKCNKVELGTPLLYVFVNPGVARNLFNLVYGKLKHCTYLCIDVWAWVMGSVPCISSLVMWMLMLIFLVEPQEKP